MGEITDTRNVPGHQAGATAQHAIGSGCLECDARVLNRCSLDEVERLLRGGYIDDVWYRAYMWGWTTWTARLSTVRDWTPRDEETWERVALLEDAAGRPRRRFPIGPRMWVFEKDAAPGVMECQFKRTINGVRYVITYQRVILADGYLFITAANDETGEVVHEWRIPADQPGAPTVHFPFWANGNPHCGAAPTEPTNRELGKVTCAECRAPFTRQLPQQAEEDARVDPAVRLAEFNPHCEWLGDDD